MHELDQVGNVCSLHVASTDTLRGPHGTVPMTAVPSTLPPTDAEDAGATLARRLGEAFQELSEPALHRVGLARTSVAFRVAGTTGVAAVIVLTPDCCRVVDTELDAEVEITFTTAQARAYARGAMVLPNELVCGAVHATGPIRPYLMADPIVRGRLRWLSDVAP